jgi:hypothetical protein
VNPLNELPDDTPVSVHPNLLFLFLRC